MSRRRSVTLAVTERDKRDAFDLLWVGSPSKSVTYKRDSLLDAAALASSIEQVSVTALVTPASR